MGAVDDCVVRCRGSTHDVGLPVCDAVGTIFQPQRWDTQARDGSGVANTRTRGSLKQHQLFRGVHGREKRLSALRWREVRVEPCWRLTAVSERSHGEQGQREEHR